MNKESQIFDTDYVGEDQTKIELPGKSEIKKFIKEPVPKDTMDKYGTSKPTRIIIKAKITNG